MELHPKAEQPLTRPLHHPHRATSKQVQSGIAHILVLALALSLFLNYKQWSSVATQKHQHPPPPNHLPEPESPALQASNPDSFNWSSLPSKPYLSYTPCYNSTFQCARLELPMDYWNASTSATLALAVVRLPAAVPPTHPQYGGAVLVNPGGPGGSGVGFAVGAGARIRETVDADTPAGDGSAGLFYDVIGFDPRGVARSAPAVHCSRSAALEQSWQVRVMEEGGLGSSDASLARLWALSHARSASCSLPVDGGGADSGEGDVREYVSTVSVARDMLELVEAHGRWREAEGERLLAAAEEEEGKHGEGKEVREKLRWRKGEEKLQYWGASYGSFLGLTFAAMFPDRVHRLVVDGVVDLEDYSAGLWYDNLVDTRKVMDSFYENCARVGYPTCALANDGQTTTAEDVRRKIVNITESLARYPLPVIGALPEVITSSDVKNVIFASVYRPQDTFPWLARLLADVSRGNGTAFAELLRPYHVFSCSASSGDSSYHFMPLNNITKHQHALLSQDATMAVACSDAIDQRNTTREEFATYLRNITRMSPSVGPSWATLRMHCIHYNIRAKYRFAGPWSGNTSHPIMLIGNTADPVTPLRNAIRFAEGFSGAVVLAQDSPGHCSNSAPCRCTKQHIRHYFQTGKLPAVGTICQPDDKPFGNWASAMKLEVQDINREKDRASQIWSALHQAGGGFIPHALGAQRDLW